MDLIKKKDYDKVYDTLYKNIYDENSCVMELTLKDFKYMNNKLYVFNKYFTIPGMILFYAPWCKTCKNLSDGIIEIAYSKINTFHIGSVNVENIEMRNDVLSSLAKVKYYPTIKMIQKDGSLKDYDGKLTIDNLLFYINSIIEQEYEL